MRFRSIKTAGSWVDVEPPAEAGDDMDEAEVARSDERRRWLQTALANVMACENLVVLTGLGVTLCLNETGKQVAPTMKDLWDGAKKTAGRDFKSLLNTVGYSSEDDGENIEALLSRCQLHQLLHPDKKIGDFIEAAEKVIADQCGFVTETTDLAVHEAFLRKMIWRSASKPRLRLFTTNYDLCFETAASRSHFVVIDGFSHTHPQEFDGSYFGLDLVRRENGNAPVYIPNVFHLYKMHGSVDWQRVDGLVRRDSSPTNPVLIYPRSTKYQSSYDQPFLEMFSRFQAALRQPNTGLLVVGFGFNDVHISRPLISAVKSNVGLRVAVVAPSLEGSDKPEVADLTQLIDGGDSRVALLNGGFEEVVPLLPNVAAPTDEEHHRERTRGWGTLS